MVMGLVCARLGMPLGIWCSGFIRCLVPLVGCFIEVHSGGDFCTSVFESIVLIGAASVLFSYLNLPSVSLTSLEYYFIALLVSVCTTGDGNLSHNMLVL